MPGDEGPSCQQLRENEQGKGVGGSEEVESDDDSKLPCLGKLKEELTCSICLDICVRPCTTPCGHNFCRRCLRGALQYSMKCPKCREMLPAGFPMNINTVLWNTIQLLFPTVCSAPSSPPPQGPLPNRSMAPDASDILGTAQLEAELEVLQLEGDSLAMDGYESLDFLLSRLEIADPYAQLELPGRYGAPQPQNGTPYAPVHGSPRVPATHRENQGRRSYRDEVTGVGYGDMYPPARPFGRRWQPRYTNHRGPDSRPSFLDSAPLYPPNLGRSQSDRRHPLRTRQQPSASAQEGAPSPGSSESGHETRPSPFNRSNSFAEWRTERPPPGPPPSHSHTAPHRSMRSRSHRFRNVAPHDSPRDSFGSPLSVSPISATAVHNGEFDAHRYFDEEEWLELATESEHLDTPRAQSPVYSYTPPPLPPIEFLGSYVGVEDRENLGRNGGEERETIDLAEYQLIEGIDGPRIIPRRHRGEEGSMRAVGPSSPVAARDLSPRSQADIQRLLLMRPVEHASYHDWPHYDGESRFMMSLLHDAGVRVEEGNGSLPSGRGSQREARDVRESRYGSVLGSGDLGEGSVGSDDSSIDLDATMNEVEGLLPYLAQADTAGYSSWRQRDGFPHRPNHHRAGHQLSRRNGVARDSFFVRENGRENLGRMSSSNRAMARETLDRLRAERSYHRYSPSMGGVELGHPDNSSQVSEVEVGESPTRLRGDRSERLAGDARSEGGESPSRDLLDSDQGGSLDLYENFQHRGDHRENEGQMLAELHHPRALRHQEVELNAPGRLSYAPMSDSHPASVSSREEFFDCGVEVPRSTSFDEFSAERGESFGGSEPGEGTSSRNESNSRTVVVDPGSSSEGEIEEQDFDRGPQQTPFHRFVSTFRRHQGWKEEEEGEEYEGYSRS